MEKKILENKIEAPENLRLEKLGKLRIIYLKNNGILPYLYDTEKEVYEKYSQYNINKILKNKKIAEKVGAYEEELLKASKLKTQAQKEKVQALKNIIDLSKKYPEDETLKRYVDQFIYETNPNVPISECYEILEVSKDTPIEKIESQYRKKSFVNNYSDSREKFFLLISAYDQLIRENYLKK